MGEENCAKCLSLKGYLTTYKHTYWHPCWLHCRVGIVYFIHLIAFVFPVFFYETRPRSRIYPRIAVLQLFEPLNYLHSSNVLQTCSNKELYKTQPIWTLFRIASHCIEFQRRVSTNDRSSITSNYILIISHMQPDARGRRQGSASTALKRVFM